jgi:diguanylate cyclase (GGDEF)-like protein/PAS domain S-box-containing protein
MEKERKRSMDAAELRRQAEAKLSELRKKTGPLPAAEVDLRRLVHELEVHQIELEMQNEELVRARAEAETAQRQFEDLYDFAPVGYFTLAQDGTILQVNLTGASLLGVERSELINRHFGVFVSPPSISTFNTFLGKVLDSPQKESCEIQLLKDGGNTIWVRIRATSDASQAQPVVCHAAMSDISLLKLAEAELMYLSSHDALTGLYSRGFFMEEMARLERGRGFPVSIVMADVDQLKAINDQQGHAAGDALLKRVAQALTDAFRTEDVVARIGGDEFAVLLPDTDATTAEKTLRRVRQIIRENNADHPKAPIRLSIGVSTAQNPKPFSDVLKEADEDMYQEKRGRYTS